MRAYAQLFGIGEPGSSLVVVADDGQPRPLTRIVRVLEEMDVHFNRVIRSQESDSTTKIIYIRVQTYNISAVHRALEQAGFHVVQPESKE
jgi:acetoin utilization protein AcuB